MKALTTLTALLFAAGAAAQTTAAPSVSLAGIGSVKIGMKKAELDKLLPQPVKLKRLVSKDGGQDTVNVSIDTISYQVVLDKSYEEADKGSVIVYAVLSNSNLLKTKSGIGIGDEKVKIVTTYDGYTIHLLPEYVGDPPVKSKTRSLVYLYGESTPTCIIFYLENNRVTGFCVQYSEGC